MKRPKCSFCVSSALEETRREAVASNSYGKHACERHIAELWAATAGQQLQRLMEKAR